MLEQADLTKWPVNAYFSQLFTGVLGGIYTLCQLVIITLNIFKAAMLVWWHVYA